jgi:cytoskeletal protein RodZ
MAIGSDLREAREQRGLTLRDISERTKIRQAVLRAIENDDFQGLPGSVIMRGFLKLYAREVGLDPDDIGRRYTAEVEGPTIEEQAIQAHAVSPGESTRRVARLAVGAILLAAVLGGAWFWLRAPETRSVSETAPQAAPALPPAAAPAPTAAAPAAVPPDPAPGPAAAGTAGAASDGLRIELQVTEDSWIAATADGQQSVYRVVGAGERVEMRAKTEAVLRIGVPTAVTISVNGRPLKPYGRPGMPTTLRITPENYRDLLAP